MSRIFGLLANLCMVLIPVVFLLIMLAPLSTFFMFDDAGRYREIIFLKRGYAVTMMLVFFSLIPLLMLFLHLKKKYEEKQDDIK